MSALGRGLCLIHGWFVARIFKCCKEEKYIVLELRKHSWKHFLCTDGVALSAGRGAGAATKRPPSDG